MKEIINKSKFMAQKYAKGDFTQVPNVSVLCGLPGQLQSVYLWICRRSDKNGECFPSISKIAKDAGVSKNTVIRSVKKLCDLGILEKTKRRKMGT